MNDYSGEKFLDKLYRNLYMSDEVQHTKENTDKRYEAIRRYLDRIENVHKKADTETKKSLLKSLYYDKYIIKEDVLRKKIKSEHNYITEETLNEEANKIINAQKESLNKWLDYLMDEHTNYPMWAKYWAFQGMLKMGNYDEGIEAYQKRSKDTESPFVDANPEIIAKAISTIEKSISKENLNDEELEKLIQSGNFSKIYTILEKRYKDNVIEYSGIEGKWIKYNQGSEEDAIRLSESLEGKNTHWCTVDKQTAIKQVCGPYDTDNGGDFYVYYTKDSEGNYTLPRIAMRMNEHDEIGEIRGILEGQNLEEELIPILEDKLNELENITEKSKRKVFETIEGLKELTEIYKKTMQKQELTQNEIENLYIRNYGFGWEEDPKVSKTIKKRDIAADFNNLKNVKIKVKLYIDSKFRLMANEKIMDSLILDEQFLKEYINLGYDAIIFKKIDPESINDYEGLALLAVQKYGTAIAHIKQEYIKDYDELARAAVTNSGFALTYINPYDVTIYDELALIAAKQGTIVGINNPKNVTNYDELARISVTKNPMSIVNVDPKNVNDYDELCRIAVSGNYHTLRFIKKEYTTIYDELATIFIKQAPASILTIDPKNVKDYDAIARISVTKIPISISNIDPKNVTIYDELAIMAVKADPETYHLVKQYGLKNPNQFLKIYNEVKRKEKFKNFASRIKNNNKDSKNKMGFIDIISITTLIFALGFMLLTILKLK